MLGVTTIPGLLGLASFVVFHLFCAVFPVTQNLKVTQSRVNFLFNIYHGAKQRGLA